MSRPTWRSAAFLCLAALLFSRLALAGDKVPDCVKDKHINPSGWTIPSVEGMKSWQFPAERFMWHTYVGLQKRDESVDAPRALSEEVDSPVAVYAPKSLRKAENSPLLESDVPYAPPFRCYLPLKDYEKRIDLLEVDRLQSRGNTYGWVVVFQEFREFAVNFGEDQLLYLDEDGDGRFEVARMLTSKEQLIPPAWTRGESAATSKNRESEDQNKSAPATPVR